MIQKRITALFLSCLCILMLLGCAPNKAKVYSTLDLIEINYQDLSENENISLQNNIKDTFIKVEINMEKCSFYLKDKIIEFPITENDGVSWPAEKYQYKAYYRGMNIAIYYDDKEIEYVAKSPATYTVIADFRNSIRTERIIIKL